MDWNDLSENARGVMRDLGHFGPTIRPELREVKGWFDGDKIYWTSDGLRCMAAGLQEVADWLDKRAAEAADAAGGAVMAEKLVSIDDIARKHRVSRRTGIESRASYGFSACCVICGEPHSCLEGSTEILLRRLGRSWLERAIDEAQVSEV